MTKRILIVDDNLALAKVLEHYLTKIGFDTSVATSGIDASELLQRKSVDLVILDIGLPDCNGLDWLEEMRARDWNFPVVIVSSWSACESQSRASSLQAPAYIRKPFSLTYLRKTVESVLNG